MLFLAAQGSAAAKVETTNQTHRFTRHHPHHLSLKARLRLDLRLARKDRSVIRFFRRHSHLLRSPEHRVVARKTLVHAERRLARRLRDIAWLRRALQARHTRALRSAPPKVAICAVFKGYCGQAVDVAWCESRLDTDAENGQYLGLFQMGYTARRLFGHGESAFAQSVAAHKYFLYTGRDWSPWSCKPASY